MEELYTPETEEVNSEEIELDFPQEELTEFSETVETTQELPAEYTEALYVTGSYIVNTILLAAFVIVGFLAATHTFGRSSA